MKKWLTILFFFFLPGIAAFAQADDQQQVGKIPERMREYIQNKLGLSQSEADRFSPVFLRYFREFVQTRRDNKGDNLVFQQKIIELRLRYRGEFRQIMDEQQANKVFKFEDEFRQKAVQIIRENRMERMPQRRFRSMLQR